MATLTQVLDTALGGKKIDAIKMVRDSGLQDFYGQYNGVWFDEPSQGCRLEHQYRSDGPEGAGYYGVGYAADYVCNNILGLKEAKDLVERLMEKASPGSVKSLVTNTVIDLQNKVTRLENRAADMEYDRDYWRAMYEASRKDLTAERQAARVTEQRLGKALRQVEGLREKVADRNNRLQEMALVNNGLADRVANLEALVTDLALQANGYSNG